MVDDSPDRRPLVTMKSQSTVWSLSVPDRNMESVPSVIRGAWRLAAKASGEPKNCTAPRPAGAPALSLSTVLRSTSPPVHLLASLPSMQGLPPRMSRVPWNFDLEDVY